MRTISQTSLSLLKGSFVLLTIWTSQAMAQNPNDIVRPNLLIGGAGIAAEADLDNININPAQLGQLPYSGAQLSWGIQSQEYQQRYPGFPAHSSDKSGLEDFPAPAFAYKVQPNLGVTGFLIPFPVEVDIDKRGLPLIILGQQNLIDLAGKGQSKGIFMGGVGYSFGPNLALGVAVSYIAFSGQFAVLESTTGGELLQGSLDSQMFSLSLGMKSRISKKLTLGLFIQGFQQAKTALEVGGQLANLQVPGDTAGGTSPPAGSELGGKTDDSTFANPIRLGLAFKVSSKITALADAEYKRKVEGKQFSLVDLSEKPKDTYDTLSVHAGLDIDLPKQKKLFIGYRNTPSSLGQGSQGTTGKAGFGFLSLIENLGGAPSRPLWAISAGYRQYFGKRLRKSRRSPRKMFAEVGFIYEEVSIGVDDSGEQPGAYLVRNIRIPFKFAYRF